ncbi:unnamed protein product [Ilex paraguariensis]|uniref:Uncharacterized protein n=1 Tax=Ilex paraguariensis TaxID=185542 RepID=A0ABC8RJI1_9AQUA
MENGVPLVRNGNNHGVSASWTGREKKKYAELVKSNIVGPQLFISPVVTGVAIDVTTINVWNLYNRKRRGGGHIQPKERKMMGCQ